MVAAGPTSYGGARMSRSALLRVAIAVAVLSLQAFAIVQQHLGPTRYFAWAPNDYIVEYSISVNVHGHDLTGTEIASRYRYLYGTSSASAGAPELTGTFEFPPRQLIDELRQYEQTYGRADGARVVLTYTLNGSAPQTWTYGR